MRVLRFADCALRSTDGELVKGQEILGDVGGGAEVQRVWIGDRQNAGLILNAPPGSSAPRATHGKAMHSTASRGKATFPHLAA
jgi:hypothetical protein